jgi:ribosomal protein RSM22 (predicted rRNA methylase)
MNENIIEYLPKDIVLCIKIYNRYVLSIIRLEEHIEFIDIYRFDDNHKTNINEFCYTLSKLYQQHERKRTLDDMEILILIKTHGIKVYNSIKSVLDYLKQKSVKNIKVTNISDLQQQSGISVYKYDLCFFESIITFCDNKNIKDILEKEIEVYKVISYR